VSAAFSRICLEGTDPLITRSNCWPSCAKLVGGRTRERGYMIFPSRSRHSLDEECRYRWQEYLKPGVSRDLRWNDKEVRLRAGSGPPDCALTSPVLRKRL
jgi:hypothetical protein